MAPGRVARHQPCSELRRTNSHFINPVLAAIMSLNHIEELANSLMSLATNLLWFVQIQNSKRRASSSMAASKAAYKRHILKQNVMKAMKAMKAMNAMKAMTGKRTLAMKAMEAKRKTSHAAGKKA